MNDHRSPAAARPAFLAAVGVLLVAALVRGIRVMHGLPDFLEEALPLRQALAMIDPASGRFDPNPHSFLQPSLAIYVHFVVQGLVFAVGSVFGLWHHPADYLLGFRLDPTIMVAAARGLGIAVDLLAIVAVIRIAERLMRGAGWVAGLIAAVSPLLVVTSTSIFGDGMMAAAGLWAIERMLAWGDGEAPRPWAAAVLIGLAAGAGYPGLLLLLPLGAAMAVRGERGTLVGWLSCAVVALAVFLATTPFAVLAWPEFARDLARGLEHVVDAKLDGAPPAGLLFLRLLVSDLGWGIMAAAAAAAFVPTLARRAPRDVVVVLVAALAAFAPIALLPFDAERQLVPTAFLVAILAAASVVAALARSAQGVRLAVGLAAIAWPLWATSQLSLESPTTTQLEARRWCEENVVPSALLIQESQGVRLLSRARLEAATRTAEFAAASRVTQDRIRSVRTFRVVTLPQVLSGRWNGRVTGPDGVRHELRAFPRPADLNRVFYDPALFAAADYVVTSSIVHDRLVADSLRVPEALALYRSLARHASVAARFEPRGHVHGPRLVIYQLDDAARAAMAADGALDPLWWTRTVASDYAERVAAVVGPQAAKPAEAGGPPLWVSTLRAPFDAKVAPFAADLALELAALERYGKALPLAMAVHMMRPEDLGAAALASVASRQTGDPARALAVLERTGRSVTTLPPELELETARAQIASGHRDEGARLLGSLVARLDSTDAVRVQADRELSEIVAASAKARAEAEAAAQAAEARAAKVAAAAKAKLAAKTKTPPKKAPNSGVATIKPGR